MNQQVTGEGTGHRQEITLVLSAQPKMFLNFTVLHPQLCLCCSRVATKPTPCANHKALRPLCHPTICQLPNALSAGLSRKLLSHLMLLPIQQCSVVVSSAPEHSYPQLGQGNPRHTNPFHPQQAGHGTRSPNPRHGWHRSPSWLHPKHRHP